MIQSKLIMAFTSADDEQTDRISNRFGVEADHEDDPGTTIKAQCCECDTFSWYHLDQFPIDVRDMIVRSLCCDDETTFVQAYRDICRSYITEGEINGQAVTMLADLDDWRQIL